eukprot:TRINITY_DN2160_c0_g1_i3.p1 TRINITY_DN2160_c0_g1~~TRINITY_DN2160_c0_g1_i3.p1  ORF type:complete len:523 (+),score=130.44 TRINITY_DN2160_c0_g1_i3:190-1758(+)
MEFGSPVKKSGAEQEANGLQVNKENGSNSSNLDLNQAVTKEGEEDEYQMSKVQMGMKGNACEQNDDTEHSPSSKSATLMDPDPDEMSRPMPVEQKSSSDGNGSSSDCERLDLPVKEARNQLPSPPPRESSDSPETVSSVGMTTSSKPNSTSSPKMSSPIVPQRGRSASPSTSLHSADRDGADITENKVDELSNVERSSGNEDELQQMETNSTLPEKNCISSPAQKRMLVGEKNDSPSPKRRRYSDERRISLSPKRRETPEDDRHVSPPKNQYSPKHRAISPSSKKRYPAEDRYMSSPSKRKHTSEDREASPRRRRHSPEPRHISPSRRRHSSADRRISPSPRRHRSPDYRRRRHERSRSPIGRRGSSPVRSSDHRRRTRSRSPPRDYYRRSPRGRYSPPRRAYPPRWRSPPRIQSRRRSPRRRHWSPPPNRNTGLGKPGNNLFVAGFSFDTTERDLERKFSRFGRITDLRIVRDKRTGESRGFGFLTLERDEDADAAIRALDQSEWNGRIVLIEKAKSANRH